MKSPLVSARCASASACLALFSAADNEDVVAVVPLDAPPLAVVPEFQPNT